MTELLVEKERVKSKIYNEVLTAEQKTKADQILERMHSHQVDGCVNASARACGSATVSPDRWPKAVAFYRFNDSSGRNRLLSFSPGYFFFFRSYHQDETYAASGEPSAPVRLPLCDEDQATEERIERGKNLAPEVSAP